MNRSLFWVFVLGLVAAPTAVLAGPPYQLDDPDVIPYQWHEFYISGGATTSPGVVNTTGPAAEFNWSGVRNAMFHFIVPMGASIPSDGPSAFGLEDSEIGFQYQFLPETKHRPMLGTFVMMEVPLGNSDRGLGAGGWSWKVPLYAAKTVAGWNIDGGGGVNISSQVPGGRNYPFGGAIITRDVTKTLTLGPELFAHGRPTADPTASSSAVDLDFGGIWAFNPRHPGMELMFAYGHSVAGEAENYSYLALYWTWGPESTAEQ